MSKNSSFVKRVMGLEEKGIFGDIENICPTDRIGDHLGRPRDKNFKEILKTSHTLSERLVPSFKAQQ